MREPKSVSTDRLLELERLTKAYSDFAIPPAGLAGTALGAWIVASG